jgi:hypothetical protein
MGHGAAQDLANPPAVSFAEMEPVCFHQLRAGRRISMGKEHAGEPLLRLHIAEAHFGNAALLFPPMKVLALKLRMKLRSRSRANC